MSDKINYSSIICPNSTGGFVCSELRGTLLVCASCCWNAKLTYEVLDESKEGWQRCPICNGTGELPTMNTTACFEKCSVCRGKKIISIKTGLPPLW
jgi:hypothetical protein